MSLIMTINEDLLGTIPSDISTLKSNMTTVKSNVSTNKTDISTLQSDMTTAKSDISTNKTDIATNTTNITNLTPKVLWSRSAGSSSFNAQTVSIDATGYDCLTVIALTALGENIQTSTTIMKLNNAAGELRYVWPGVQNSNVYTNVARRRFTYSTSGITFTDATSSRLGVYTNPDNGRIIPTTIIGWKVRT